MSLGLFLLEIAIAVVIIIAFRYIRIQQRNKVMTNDKVNDGNSGEPKVKLTQIDIERWRYVLYESIDGGWFAEFSYSPISFTDSSMLIKLTEEEKIKAESSRQYLVDLADTIRYYYKDYLERELDRADYIIDR